MLLYPLQTTHKSRRFQEPAECSYVPFDLSCHTSRHRQTDLPFCARYRKEEWMKQDKGTESTGSSCAKNGDVKNGDAKTCNAKNGDTKTCVAKNSVTKTSNAKVLQTTGKLRKQYHPAFCEAMKQIFEHDTCRYEYRTEFPLNSMPNRIDFVIIKQDADAVSSHGIGKLFRKYNICHYKSPNDALNESEYHLAQAYAHLYAHYLPGVPFRDITISFIREGKPRKLLKYFREEGFRVSNEDNGIYYVKRDGFPDMQVIATRELDDGYIWLKALSHRLTKEDAMKLADEAIKEKDPQGQIRVRSILDLVTLLNRDQIWMKEMKEMGAFWDYFFKDEYDKKVSEIAERDETIQTLSKQVQSQNEQLQSKDQQLQTQNEQLQSKDQQLQTQNEQLQSKDQQLQSERKEISRLRREIEELKKQLGKIAAL